MAGEVQIELVHNPHTGRIDIIVDYRSPASATQREHEAVHRRIVATLLGSGVLQPGQEGVVIERGSTPAGAAAAPAEQPQQPTGQQQGQ